MKPLSAKQREFLYSHLAEGRARPFVQSLYDVLIRALVGVHRAEEKTALRQEVEPSELTLVIKTFDRPYAIKRLLKSIRRRYPTVPIIVADDGKRQEALPGVEHLRLPFDVGLSAGRNRALEKVRTKYFLLLDDDFLFSKRQRLAELVDYMEAFPQVDIAGGRYIDLPLYIEHEFDKQAIGETSTMPLLPLGTRLGEGVVVDKVQNYFIGRTETVRALGWNEIYKLQEHTEFFTRARGKLVTVYLKSMRVLHVKYPFDLEYLAYRNRVPYWVALSEVSDEVE